MISKTIEKGFKNYLVKHVKCYAIFTRAKMEPFLKHHNFFNKYSID